MKKLTCSIIALLSYNTIFLASDATQNTNTNGQAMLLTLHYQDLQQQYVKYQKLECGKDRATCFKNLQEQAKETHDRLHSSNNYSSCINSTYKAMLTSFLKKIEPEIK